jgi:hypothetical protein
MALPGRDCRYLTTRSRVAGSIGVFGIALPGAVPCGSSMIAAMYSGERR